MYAESLQQKYEDSEKARSDMLETTKELINVELLVYQKKKKECQEREPTTLRV